jgi:tripartite ATP-independent transporter DctP family solute receptor
MFKFLPKLMVTLLVPGALLLAGHDNAAAQVQARTIRLSASNNAAHPQNLGGIKFVELVAQKSGGKIDVKIFHSGVLGGDTTSISALQGGTLDMMIGTVNLLSANEKEYAVFEFPFLFKTAEEADAVLDGPIGKELLDKMQTRGLIGLSYYELGFRSFHTRVNKPIKTADDFVGKKLRVQPTSVYIDFVNSLGGNAVPMNFSETYTGLEQGVIDGMSNPFINILDGKYYEVSKNLAITNHIYQPSWIGMSKKTWDKLSQEEKNIIQSAADESRDYQRKLSREMSVKALAELRKQGMVVTEFTPVELDKMREKAKPVIAKHTQLIGQEFVARVYAEIDKYRNKVK